ncbi:acetyltransferase (GNAT) family protein [Gelidibacter sediminis]|uniref:Acetyltransferase (GNAT) family protein n=1 Tax=Gelidibacter sediminis TaxID=1608710 RepID=A0A4V6Q4L7_9FLAO|nr:GNAT family N-acetyltransferase [Gelidibacter sediminis]TDU39996.1 acetyltransferase (GNAT) family protein [Gelidibacter sediminis]
MKSNPFTSAIYENIWLKHYGKGQKASKFNFLNGVKFIEGKLPRYYTNIGENYTSGLFYRIDQSKSDYEGKVCVIFDVPEYLHSKLNLDCSNLKILKIQQYKGLYVNLKNYKSLDEVIFNCYNSGKSRYNFRRSLKQLHKNHDISKKMFFGQISEDEYIGLIHEFKRILETRFTALNTHNTVLPMWDFYKEVLFPLINDKHVALFVIYDAEQPIAMSFNFVYGDNLVVALRTFDIKYNRIGLGNIEIYYLIEWCLENNINILDFSKGESDYKERWCDTEYRYQHHIIYDSKSGKATAVAIFMAYYYRLKQFLRDQNINSRVTKLQFRLKKWNVSD